MITFIALASRSKIFYNLLEFNFEKQLVQKGSDKWSEKRLEKYLINIMLLTD